MNHWKNRQKSCVTILDQRVIAKTKYILIRKNIYDFHLPGGFMNSDTISIRFIIKYYNKMSHIARFSDIQFCIFCAMILRKSQNLSIDRYVRLLRIFRILLVLIQSFITKMICRQILTQKSKLFFFYNKKIKLLVCFFVPQNQSNRYIQ